MKRSLGAKTTLWPTPVLVIGTWNADRSPNVMTASWGGICCSRPPCVAVSLRAATHSHGNIQRTQAFTISIPSTSHAQEVDFFGLVSGREVDKLGTTHLTAVASQVVRAPYVAEFPLVLECRLLQTHELGLHTQFIGQILDVKADEAVLDERGKVDLSLMAPFSYDIESGHYHGVGADIGKAFSLGMQFRNDE